MLARIEQAIVARLLAAVPALGYRLHAASYGGQLESGDGLAQLVTTLPAAFVTFASEAADGGRGRLPHMKATFNLILAARNPQTEAASRQGAAGGAVGVYQLKADAAALLTGCRLGLDIDPLELGRCRAIYNGPVKSSRLAVLQLELTTGYFAPVAEDPDAMEIGDFLTAHVEWTGRGDTAAIPLPDPDPAAHRPDLIPDHIEVRS